MRKWLWAAAGAVCAVMLGACGPVNPVIGTGESSVMVTNDLSATITSLEVLAGAPEGFETILPTEDVETIEPGQTVQVNYEVGEAVYDPGTAGSGQTDQTAEQPIAEPTAEVGDAPNAVYLDSDGRRTSEDRQNGTDASATDAENGEEELVDEVTGTDEEATSETTTSTTGLESMPIQGDAIRVVADGKTIVFDGLNLPAYKQISLRVTDDGVGYVDYVGTNDESGSTKETATTAAEQWKAAQEAAKKQAEADDAAAAAAVAAEGTTAENGTDPNAGYDEGYTNTEDQGGSEGYTNTDDQGGSEGYANTDTGYVEPSYDEPSYDEPSYDTGSSGDTGGNGGSVDQNEGNCIDIPDSEIN